MFLLLVPLLLFFSQCEKEKTTTADLPISVGVKVVQNPLLNDLKGWYSNTVEKYRKELIPSTSGLRKTSRMLNPQWTGARIETLSNGAKAAIVPSKEYTLDNKKLFMLREFVFLLNPAGTKIKNGKIVEIIGEADYIKKNKDKLTHLYNSDFIRGFNGTIMTYDVNYRFLWSKTFKNGIIKGTAKLSVQSSLTSAIQSFGTVTTVFGHKKSEDQDLMPSASQCFIIVLISTYTDGSTEMEVLGTYCSPEESGGGTGGGNPPGNGNGTVTPGSSFGGFPSSPYDGQVYFYNYPNGSVGVFTFNSEFNAWLLPGIQLIVDKGYDMQFQTTVPPNFDGAALSTLVLSSLAEPTFIGELFLAGYVTIKISVFAYEYAQYITHTYNIPNSDQLERCIAKFVECTETSTPDSRCADCLHLCRSSGGYWDNTRCPL